MFEYFSHCLAKGDSCLPFVLQARGNDYTEFVSSIAPDVVGAILGGLFSAVIALWVTRSTIKSDRQLQEISRHEEDAAKALVVFTKLRRYAQMVAYIRAYVTSGVARAKEHGLSEDQYMRMMGGLSGTPSAPDKLSVADYAFLFLPGNEDLINDMNDLEESAITLTEAVSEFTVRNMQFGEILVKMSDGKPTVEGKSILVERMPGETHILEIQMRDLLAQIRFLLDRLSDLPERTVQNFVDHAHGHFGKSFRQFQYRVKPATPTVS